MSNAVTPTIREIVAEWLKANDYDGLGREGCCCELADLMPCDEPGPDCWAGYRGPCPGPEGCECDGDFRFHMVREKPTPLRDHDVSSEQ